MVAIVGIGNIIKKANKFSEKSLNICYNHAKFFRYLGRNLWRF